jgi:hypothetical protein
MVRSHAAVGCPHAAAPATEAAAPEATEAATAAPAPIAGTSTREEAMETRNGGKPRIFCKIGSVIRGD